MYFPDDMKAKKYHNSTHLLKINILTSNLIIFHKQLNQILFLQNQEQTHTTKPPKKTSKKNMKQIIKLNH
jgi:hypothetical protein